MRQGSFDKQCWNNAIIFVLVFFLNIFHFFRPPHPDFQFLVCAKVCAVYIYIYTKMTVLIVCASMCAGINKVLWKILGILGMLRDVRLVKMMKKNKDFQGMRRGVRLHACR